MIIRDEEPRDYPEIYQINCAAFDSNTEAELVNALRKAGGSLVSLVAEENGTLLGHIMFSPVTIEHNPQDILAAGLAPLAVLPAFHGKGVGGELINTGLEKCRVSGIQAAVVLGDPTYFQRFGFSRADGFQLLCEYDTPPDCFMALELIPGVLSACTGKVKYHPVFHEVES
jgi:putative acetyltransferase